MKKAFVVDEITAHGFYTECQPVTTIMDILPHGMKACWTVTSLELNLKKLQPKRRISYFIVKLNYVSLPLKKQSLL